MASIETLTWFPINMKFSFGFMVWIERNLCIVLETWVVAVESSHQVLEGTLVRFDSKHTETKPLIRHLPFFSNHWLRFRQSFWWYPNFLQKWHLSLPISFLWAWTLELGSFALYGPCFMPFLGFLYFLWAHWLTRWIECCSSCLSLASSWLSILVIQIPLILHNVVINLKWPILRGQGIQDELPEKELIHIHPQSL